jgi:hypothetical protein
MAKDMYNYLTKEKGVDHAHAVGILANVQNESKFNSGALGDYQGGVATSGGLFQHHNERFSAMQQSAGPNWQKNWKGQIDFALSEKDMQNYLKRPVNSGQEAAQAFVYDFERPKDKSGEASRRAANVPAVEKLIGGASTAAVASTGSGNVGSITPQSTPSSTNIPESSIPSADPIVKEQPVSDNTSRALNPEVPSISGGHQHGGELHTRSGVDTGHLQPDIVSKFKTIQSQAGADLTVTSGFRDPQHNAAVGGAQNSAHTRGNAIDVVFGGGIPQALKLIEAASKAGIGGIGVYSPGKLHFDTESKRAWGPTYHSDSIPQWAIPTINAHLGGKTPENASGKMTPGSSVGGATPIGPMAMGGGETGGGAATGAPMSLGDKFSMAQQMVSSFAMQNGMGMGMGGMGGLASMIPFGSGLGMLMSALPELLGSDISPQSLDLTSQPAEQLTPELTTANKIQMAAIEDKVTQSLQSYNMTENAAEKQKTTEEETIPYKKYYPEGQFNSYNTDDHLYPSWMGELGRNYGDVFKNIKTHF